jgi:hypothetical protein
METTNNRGAIGHRILQNIRFTARSLAKANASPGMGFDDYEQDLITNLIRRTPAFDPARASYPTFADVVIRHRARDLSIQTVSRRAECQMMSLDAVMPDVDGTEQSLLDRLPDEAALSDDAVALRIDLRRLLSGLTQSECQGLEILLDDNVAQGARRAGINRSTAYDRIERFRARVATCGLAAYAPNSSAVPPVCERTTAREGIESMVTIAKAISPRLFTTDSQLCSWLNKAKPGDVFEYYRGFLVADRVPQGSRLPDESRRELLRVAQRAREAAERGTAHLVQRRYAGMDYAYLIVVSDEASLVGGAS